MANYTTPRRISSNTPPSAAKKAKLRRAVKLTVKQYRKTLELLAKT